jgi:hypothetical protein
MFLTQGKMMLEKKGKKKNGEHVIKKPLRRGSLRTQLGSDEWRPMKEPRPLRLGKSDVQVCEMNEWQYHGSSTSPAESRSLQWYVMSSSG